MNDYIDLVLIRFNDETHLCYAPQFSHLEKGDLVVLEDDSTGIVIKSITLGKYDEEVIDFIKEMIGTDTLIRITAKVVYEKLSYEEDEE